MKAKKATIMIQARVGSRRFPKKVLVKIEKKPLISHVINRVKLGKGIDQIILITTKRKDDKILLKIANENGILSFAGNSNDVLDRHYQCAKLYNADPIIRITGDCPLIDPNLITKFLRYFRTKKYDYTNNNIPPSYPNGLDVEIFSFKALEKAALNAKMQSEREHVSPYIRNNPKKFKIYSFKNKIDLSKHRWTVDEKKDLKFVRKVFSLMRPKLIFYTEDILKIISKNPQILKINSGINPNEGYQYSLNHDIKIK